MEDRYYTPRRPRGAKKRKARLNPGFVLCSVCTVIIFFCLIIGGIQFLVAQGEAKEAAALAAKEEAARAEEERLAAEAAAAAEAAKYDFTLSFMGDINLDDGWSTMVHLGSQPNGIQDVFGASLLEQMESSDLFCVNSEFAFTNGGTKLDGKAYTFRSHTSNVSIYQEMGVDLVTLANNHVYDYGPEGLTDTLNTLSTAGIDYVGAGENITDAAAPRYIQIQGKTISFVNASCAEVHRFTPEATEDSSGILLCYDTSRFLQSIREAKQNSDYVVALVHWGTDYEYAASDIQRSTAQDYINAGADIVIGSHSHCLQGVEYYNDSPIFYSLGSCWFNDKTLETFMLQLHFTGNGNGGEVSVQVLPALQKGIKTRFTETDEETRQVFDLIMEYSDGVYFDADGYLMVGETPEEPIAYHTLFAPAPPEEEEAAPASEEGAAPEEAPAQG